MKRSKLVVVFIICFSLLIFAKDGISVCKGLPLNPIIDVCWHCIFPLKLGGVTIVPGPAPELALPDISTVGGSGPLCTCPMPPPIFVRVGIPLSFWEPARLIETVKEPFCFPTLGTGLSGMFGYQQGGYRSTGSDQKMARSLSAAQFHWFIFLPSYLLELVTAVACLEGPAGFDLGYISEIDPLWNNELLAFILNPEALLFGNPVAMLACIPDSIASNIGHPLDPLFWCAGSWGKAYPLAGKTDNGDYVEGNAHLAAKATYRMARLMFLIDTATWVCAPLITPIWIKSHWRYQIAKPVRDFIDHPVGRSGLIWSWAKNPPMVGDNFLWVLFRKKVCCVF